MVPIGTVWVACVLCAVVGVLFGILLMLAVGMVAIWVHDRYLDLRENFTPPPPPPRWHGQSVTHEPVPYLHPRDYPTMVGRRR